MLRFLLIRVFQAVPVLLIMSMITFVIIQAPPGDYGDFIRSNMITQGNASIEAASAAAEAYRKSHGLNDPMIVQYSRWIWVSCRAAISDNRSCTTNRCQR